jgi:hypothetical protein
VLLAFERFERDYARITSFAVDSFTAAKPSVGKQERTLVVRSWVMTSRAMDVRWRSAHEQLPIHKGTDGDGKAGRYAWAALCRKGYARRSNLCLPENKQNVAAPRTSMFHGERFSDVPPQRTPVHNFTHEWRVLLGFPHEAMLNISMVS